VTPLSWTRGRNGEDFLLPAPPHPTPPHPTPPPVFILRSRPAPLFQDISINGIDTKGRKAEDLLLPASPHPAPFRSLSWTDGRRKVLLRR
jgi:hypothetical protein